MINFAKVEWGTPEQIQRDAKNGFETLLTKEEAIDFLVRNGSKIKEIMIEAGNNEVDALLPIYFKEIGKECPDER